MACIAGCAIEPDAVDPHFQSVARLRTLYEKRPRQRIVVRYRPPHSRQIEARRIDGQTVVMSGEGVVSVFVEPVTLTVPPLDV